MPFPPADGAARPLGMAPVGTRDERPPARVIVERYRPWRRREHERSGHEQGRIGARIIGGVRRDFRGGDVSGVLHEAPELGDGHRVRVHPEPVDRHLVDRSLLRIEVLGPHPERASGDEGHVLRRGTRHDVSLARPGSGREGRTDGRDRAFSGPVPAPYRRLGTCPPQRRNCPRCWRPSVRRRPGTGRSR